MLYKFIPTKKQKRHRKIRKEVNSIIVSKIFRQFYSCIIVRKTIVATGGEGFCRKKITVGQFTGKQGKLQSVLVTP